MTMFEIRVFYTNMEGSPKEKISIVGDVFSKLVAADCAIYKMLQENDILNTKQIKAVKVKRFEENESIFSWYQLGHSGKELAKPEYVLSETYRV